jgi:hypothetical protein
MRKPHRTPVAIMLPPFLSKDSERVSEEGILKRACRWNLLPKRPD